MRLRFDEQLTELKKEMILLGSLCENAIALATRSLVEHQTELAAEVPGLSERIERKERNIEELCLKLLLRQQPVARDLRQISAALKIITDMERIGDQAEDIAEIISFLGGRTTEGIAHIEDMARETIKMVTESVDAFVKKDVELAERAILHDDVVDALFAEMKKTIIKLVAENPDEGEFALDLLMISKYFVRIGDHATNIAEWVIYSVTGTHKEV